MAARRKQRPAPAAQRQGPPAAPGPRFSSAAMLLVAAALVGLNLYTFGQLGHQPFSLLDDPAYVLLNQHVQGGLTWTSVKWAWLTFDAANWHPVTWLSHLIDAQFFGNDPRPQHLVSLAIHVVSSLVLFIGLRRLTGAMAPSALVAALFSVHPLNVESVAWIAERKNVISTLCWWLTIGAYVLYVRRPNPARYGAVVVLFAIGLMAKPMLVTLPLTLLLIDVWPLERATWPWRTPLPAIDRTAAWPALIREKVPLFLMAAASAVVTVIAQRSGGAVVELGTITLAQRLANAPISYFRYLEKTFWPRDLVMFYPYPAAIEWTALAIAVVVLLAISVVAIRLADRKPYVLAGWLWYLVTLVPVIGVIQVGRQAMADRYAYVPLVGVFVAVVWGLRSVAEAWRVPVIVRALPAVAVVVVFAMTSRVQASYWDSTERLLRHALDVMPDNLTALHGLAGIQAREGRHDEALAMFKRARDASPGDAGLRAEMADEYAARGGALGEAGRFAEAIQDFSAALQLAPASPGAVGARYGLGLALVGSGRLAEARAEFERVLRENPGHDGAKQALARIK